MSEGQSQRRWVFEALVRDENDVQGLIAYAFYKKGKHELAKRHRRQGKTEPEIQKIVDDFHDNVLDSGLIDVYKDQASRFLSATYGTIIKDYERKKSEDIKKFIKSAEKQAKEHLTRKDILRDQFIGALFNAFWAVLISIIFIGAVHVMFNEASRREIMASAIGKYFAMGEVAKEYQSARPEGPQAQTSRGAP